MHWYVYDALSSEGEQRGRIVISSASSHLLLSITYCIYLEKGRREASRHSLVVIMNGTREGSHTDPAASQVDQFTQPVSEAEGKRKHFIVQF